MKDFNNKNRKKPFKKKKEKNNPFWNTIHEIRTMSMNFFRYFIIYSFFLSK